MVDNASIEYTTAKSVDVIVNHTARFFKTEKFQIEKSKFWFRNLSNKKYEYINYISISEFRGKTRISVSFSYSRFKNKDNYRLINSEKEANDVHTHIVQMLQAITGEPLTANDLSLTSLDICNQLEANFENKYQTFELLNKILYKQQTTLYFSTDKNNRKIIQGFSIIEAGKGKKEQKTYFKIYNKFKENIETGKSLKDKSQAVRAELSLKKRDLKFFKINSLKAVNRKTLDEIIKKFLGSKIKLDLKKVLKEDIEKLIELANKRPFSQQDFLKYEYLIFDTEFLKYIFAPQNSNMSERSGFYHKKIIIEQLNDLEKKGEIVKKYSGNIKDLEKILDKLFKTKVKIKATAKGIDIKWLE